MLLVETVLRPARIAWLLPQSPSARSANQTFRLATRRWGGIADPILICPAQDLTSFVRSALRLADPDIVVLGHHDLARRNWNEAFSDLRIQPFTTLEVKDFKGRRDLARLLRPSPGTEGEDGGPQTCRAAHGTNFSWRTAARLGLLDPSDGSRQPADNQGVPSAVDLSAKLLSPWISGRWLLVAPSGVSAASRYWTLRALGRRVSWISVQAALARRPPTLSAIYDLAELSSADAERVRDHYAQAQHLQEATGDTLLDPGARRASSPAVAQQALAIAPHRDHVHLTLPTIATGLVSVAPSVLGVVEHRLRSLDPQSPDGVVLNPDEESRQLLAGPSDERRITVQGFAALQPIGAASLQAVPVISYDQAVKAPLTAGGFQVGLSDKGRFHAQLLDQARGIRFLAWVLTQSESRSMLESFDSHHAADQNPTLSYRRSVTFQELSECLHALLRADTGRLSRTRRIRGDAWLRLWADELLDRGLLVAGAHLKCPACLLGAFYEADRAAIRFVCDRCGTATIVPADTPRRLQLGDLFHLFRRQHGDVVTLVLAYLRREARASFLYLPEVDLVPSRGQKVEIDFAALVDGGLAVGEAKSNDRVTRKEIERLIAAARRTRAKRLIFATSQLASCGPSCEGCSEDGVMNPDHAWAPGTRKLIREAASQLAPRGIDVLCLSGEDLLTAPSVELGLLADSDFVPAVSRPDARAANPLGYSAPPR